MTLQRARRAPPLPEHLIWDLEPGLHADGHGLYLRVLETGSRSWVLIDFDHGRRRERGLGGAKRVSLAEARTLARNLKDPTWGTASMVSHPPKTTAASPCA